MHGLATGTYYDYVKIKCISFLEEITEPDY